MCCSASPHHSLELRTLTTPFYSISHETSRATTTMDPLSITAAVTSLLGASAKATLGLYDIYGKWKMASLTIKMMASECKVTEAALTELQAILLQREGVLMSSMGNGAPAGSPALPSFIISAFESAICSSAMTMSVLNDDIDKMLKNIRPDGTISARTSIRYLLDEASQQQLLQQIYRLQTGINLLFSTMQRSVIE